MSDAQRQHSRPLLHQASSAIPEEGVESSSSSKTPVPPGMAAAAAAAESARPPVDGEPEPEGAAAAAQKQQQEIEAATPRRLPLPALRGWQRLQKSTKRIVLGPQLSVQPIVLGPPATEAVEGEGADAAAPDAGAGAVVLDMEGDGGAGAGEEGDEEGPARLGQLGLGVSASRHRAVKSIMDMSSAPMVISEEVEQGLELLAHAVVADARAARAEAAEVRAAAAEETDEDGAGGKGGRGERLLGIESPRASGGDHQSLEPSPRELPQSEPAAAAPEDGLMGPNREQGSAAPARLPSVKRSQLQTISHAQQHAHQGRKAVIMAKQQLVRTLTLSKHGETVEMELPIKELLRYIQNAVRAVHISHGQYQSQQSIGASLGVREGHTRSVSATPLAGASGSGPVLRRSTQHSRTYSQSNAGLAVGAGPSVAVASTRTAVPTPVGGLLNARDVRRLISGLDTESVKSKEMSILVRRHTIVLNLDIIRCLVLWDRLIVVVPEGADSHCLDHLEENLRWLRVQQRAFDMDDATDEDDDEEFEFLALEAVLMTVCNQLKNKLKDMRPHIVKNAKALLGTGTLNTKHQDTLRQLKGKVASYQAKVRSLHRALFDLLDDEEHLQMLHLTRIYTQTQQQHVLGGGALDADGAGGLTAVDADRDDEAEVLLESFLSDCSELIAKWELVKEDMNNTETFTNMRLDMARNRLLTIGTVFALINLCFAFGALVVGAFGMNLQNGLGEGPHSFDAFIGIVSLIAVVVVVSGGSVMIWMHQSRILVA